MVMEPPTLPPSAIRTGHGAGHGLAPLESVPQLNPQTLGREFVRQYYTILNQAPHLLHRFYSDDSSMIHGSLCNSEGTNLPVYGQMDINSCIMALNFKDCHALIRQLDALETLEKGVVVQVTGELSNDGLPMRRFFQTFVLAPKSPTNYYVRNDIFRYQDDVFAEDDELQDVADHRLDRQVEPPLGKSQSPIKSIDAVVNPVSNLKAQMNGHQEISSVKEPIDHQAQPSVVPLTVVPPTIVEPAPRSIPSTPHSITISELKSDVDGITSSKVIPAKLSWASRVADGSNPQKIGEIRHVQSMAPTSSSSVLPTPQTVSPKGPNLQAIRSTPGIQSKVVSRAPKPKSKFDRDNVNPTPAGEAEGNEEKSKPALSNVVYADEQQVFVGNLPQDITEDDLRKIFSKYGNILDVRINQTNQKSFASRTPNFGFVTFENAKIVKSILAQKPIYYNEHRFNVEEKRSPGRPDRPSFPSARPLGGPMNAAGNFRDRRDLPPGGKREGGRPRDGRPPFDKFGEGGGRRPQATVKPQPAPSGAPPTRPPFQKR